MRKDMFPNRRTMSARAFLREAGALSGSLTTKRHVSPGLSLAWLGLVVGVLSPSLAVAQSAMNSLQGEINRPRAQENYRTQSERQRMEQAQERATGPVEAPQEHSSVAAPKGSEKVRFLLKEVTFSESSVFTKDELDAFTDPYVGHEISVADLFTITQTINTAYRKRGYVTTQAILPPQQIAGGKVKIVLVEGTIEDISVLNPGYLHPSYVVSQMGIEPGSIPTLQSLSRQAAAINWNRNFQVVAGLKPGKAPGTTDVDLDVGNKPKPISGTVYVDNSGSKENGQFSVGNMASLYSLLGVDDMLTLGYTRSFTRFDEAFDSQAVGSFFLNALAPLPVGHGNVRFLYSHSDSRVLEGDFASLGIDGRGDFFGITFSQPFYISELMNLSVVTGGQYSDTRSSVGIVDTNTLSWRYFGGLNGRMSIQKTGTYLEADLRGFGSWVTERGLSGEEKRPITRLVGNATIFQTLPYGFSAQVRAAGQVTDNKRLPSGEQWYMGGGTSLPAYQLSSLSGDNGFYAASQLRYAPPVLRSAVANAFGIDMNLGIRGFFDVGGVFDDYQSVLEKNYFMDAGVGLDFSLAKHLTSDFSVAWPVGGKSSVTSSNPDTPRFLFTVAMTF